MKTFKKILSEVAQPKSAEEKRFKDQHKVELIRHPVALDSQFTGEIEGVTRKPRPADQEGDAAYDQAYAVKDKPFTLPRNVDESFEEEDLDEEEMELWSVEIPKQHGVNNKNTVKIKARNTREAVRKAASKIGLKDRWMSIKIGKVKRLGRVAEEVESLEEKSVSQAQQKLMGMALAYKRGEMDDASDKVKELAKSMSEKDLEDFAGTKHKGLPTKKEGISFKGLLDKIVTEETEEIFEAPEYVSEEPQEEISMMMRQLHFIGYAADEIMEYLAIEDLDPEEWWQNKLANTFSMMQTLYSYSKGSQMAMAAGYYGEEVELEEANFKPSNLKLKNGQTVKLSMEDAKALNAMMNTLNAKNKKEMEETLMSNREGFNEILAFAKEAV